MKKLSFLFVLALFGCASKIGYHPKVEGNPDEDKYERDRQICMRKANSDVAAPNYGVAGGTFGLAGIAVANAYESRSEDEINAELVASIDACMTSRGYKVTKLKDPTKWK